MVLFVSNKLTPSCYLYVVLDYFLTGEAPNELTLEGRLSSRSMEISQHIATFEHIEVGAAWVTIAI